jgi:hypothetical protein
MMIKSTSTFDRIMADPKQKGTLLKLQNALAEGERSAEQGGWLSAADVRKKF